MPVVVVAVVALALAGCGSAPDTHEARLPIVDAADASELHYDGIGAVHFGQNWRKLAADHQIVGAATSCLGQREYDLPGFTDQLDLIFDKRGRLEFVWVFSPDVRTAADVGVGSTAADVRRAYPGAQQLPSNERAHPALFAGDRDSGILFLYDETSEEVLALLAGPRGAVLDAHRNGVAC